MGDFYNKGRTPTSANMRSGVPVCFSPRTWQYVPFEEEASGSIQALVRKGFLTRRDAPGDHVVSEETGNSEAVPPIVPEKSLAVEPTIQVASPKSEVLPMPEIEKEVDADVVIDDSSGAESLSRSRSSRRR